MALTFSIDGYADVRVLRPAGRVTNDEAPAFQAKVVEAVEQSGDALVVIDFAGLDYVSSGGLRGVAKGARLCRERNGQLMVAALTSVVQEIFAISRFHQVVTVHPTVTDAVAALSADALAALEAASK
ncbi:MAG: STAS domain-containing protein [Alphaproteobacteria bacterium]